jgi:hypothetical protein
LLRVRFSFEGLGKKIGIPQILAETLRDSIFYLASRMKSCFRQKKSSFILKDSSLLKGIIFPRVDQNLTNELTGSLSFYQRLKISFLNNQTKHLVSFLEGRSLLKVLIPRCRSKNGSTNISGNLSFIRSHTALPIFPKRINKHSSFNPQRHKGHHSPTLIKKLLKLLSNSLTPKTYLLLLSTAAAQFVTKSLTLLSHKLLVFFKIGRT